MLYFVIEATHIDTDTEVIFRCDGEHFYLHYRGRHTSRLDFDGQTMAIAFYTLINTYSDQPYEPVDEDETLHFNLTSQGQWKVTFYGRQWQDETASGVVRDNTVGFHTEPRADYRAWKGWTLFDRFGRPV